MAGLFWGRRAPPSPPPTGAATARSHPLCARCHCRPLEFLITTGPGPVPRLDGENIAFGRVLEGINTVIDISAVPSFQPDARSQQLNAFAKVGRPRVGAAGPGAGRGAGWVGAVAGMGDAPG